MKYKPHKNEFWIEKIFFKKLMNSSVYGKTTEKKINAKLVNNAQRI